MNEQTFCAAIEDEVSAVDRLVARVVNGGFDDDIVDAAQTELSEVKAASQRMLVHGEAGLRALIAGNDPAWRTYKATLKGASVFLNSLL